MGKLAEEAEVVRIKRQRVVRFFEFQNSSHSFSIVFVRFSTTLYAEAYKSHEDMKPICPTMRLVDTCR